MFLWRRTIGVSLGLVAASSLWTVAQAYPAQEEVVETPVLIQVDDTKIVDVQVDDLMQVDDPSLGQSTTEPLIETMPIASDVTSAIAAEAPVAEVTAVPTEVLDNLSQEQLEAIASIISTAEASTSPDRIANLPTEVLTQLDALPGVEQQVGRRRWLPTGLVRRLRLPQMLTSLVRQPKNTALMMLGNHIVVVNPATGAVLGAVLSAL
ncbi:MULTISPECIES: hypothetical protein [Cyanophyceae]|uniref:hypothetical protein n=1 Tax=Cyanophyceae TaxID=3028117 RepID=UPI00168565F3|nr:MULTISPECIES: hypothetical protein [Cyanophyceae]MBD1917581.1 hypothetical protein [Phormidium sp. FACHB-77]MBD2029544.1 hypothetical protein [Phormidium sp. FACHB-322]MBD2050805.1 hypothetical protein [Leptolyngbya sp. FACHB-60]